MLTQERAAEIFARIRRFSSADEVEVLFTGARFALTRFANNTIHQNVEEENYVASIRTNLGGRTARATANQFDDETLRRAVAASEALARVQEPDPDLLPMPDAQEAEGATLSAPIAPSRFFEQTASITPGDRASTVKQIVSVAGKHNLTAAGIDSSSQSIEGIFNSRGLARWHTQTLAEISITMLREDSSGWQKLNSPDARALDPAVLAEAAARKAIESARPREIPPGKYTVILEPAAVLDIVGFMMWDFSGMAVLDQRSFLNNRIGTKLFGDNINIWDDAAHPLQAGPPFDGEGLRRERVQLVDRGVVSRIVFARGTAAKLKKSDIAQKVGSIEATGHGYPLPNEMGEAPLNIVVGSAENPQTTAQMIASTERGLLVTRLWYIREVDPYEKIMTGMTRDGTFLIENGKAVCGVRNFRFNQSLISMLSNVEALASPVRASGEESIDMVVPAMKVKDFNFTEVTKF